MTYEIKTPLIAESVDAIRKAIDGISTGSIDPRPANIMITGARALQGAVAIDIKARLADPKIRASEAKVIEAEKAKKMVGAS